MCCFKHTRRLNKSGRASRNESYRKEWRYHSQSLGCLDKRISLGSSKRQRKVIPCDKLEMSDHGFLSPSVDVCGVEFIDVATSRDILSCKSEDVLLHLFMKTTAKCEKHDTPSDFRVSKDCCIFQSNICKYLYHETAGLSSGLCFHIGCGGLVSGLGVLNWHWSPMDSYIHHISTSRHITYVVTCLPHLKLISHVMRSRRAKALWKSQEHPAANTTWMTMLKKATCYHNLLPCIVYR